MYNSIEKMTKEEIDELFSKKLRKLIKYVYNNSPFYKKRFDENNINIEDIKTIEDIEKLPFTYKEDLRDNYPYGIFSNVDDLTELHVSSGTTGNPTLVGYTKDDIQLWSNAMARTLATAGAKKGDVIQIAYGYGMFTGGLGFHYGALELGLRIIPMSSGNTKRQIKIMQDFQPKILGCTPSYALYIAEEMKKMGLDPKKSSWKIGIFGAEPWSAAMREEIEDTLGITALDVYGLSEIIGPGVAQECPQKAGLHVLSDLFYPEVINPETGKQVADNEDGELVFTTFDKQGIPLIRYRTRDIVSIDKTRCECGSILPRISKIKGRTDDMIVVRGINIFPSQVEHVLLQIEGTTPHYQLFVTRTNNLDTLEIKLELEKNLFSDEIKKLTELKNKIKSELQAVLSLSAKVTFMEPNSMPRFEGKAQRVIDNRNI